ncbi:hypothetical protein SAMN05216218_11268 [Halorientalis regularis]|jgi:hypothetical protein|uniref:Uncharacterized protein n=1 Tax=Halorientalis regularis TaxID=660518 RepID=A0A1G7QBF4_9EURY|nr:hypothetical protein SAMN05216218_11268 [Halorientalis regularis]
MSHYWTTIRLTKTGERWTATQHGVDATGTGETAQQAAADYCATVEEQVNGTRQEPTDTDRVTLE